MPLDDLTSPHSVIVASASAVVAVAMLLWLGFALSRLFPRWGRAAWKGWVPLVNAAEILSVAGFRAWQATLLVIPVLQVYALVLLAVAVHRITARTGHGPGLTLVGLILPPLWATVLLRDDGDPRDPHPVSGAEADEGRSSGAEAPPVPSAPRSGATSGMVPPRTLAPHVRTAEPAERAPSRVPANATLSRTPAFTVSAEPSAPVEATSELPAFLRGGTPADRLAAAARHPAGVATSHAGYDHGDTVVVDRRPHVRWALEVDGVGSLPLTAGRVILGRAPVADDGRSQTLPIPDPTRTLSKSHARLDLDDGEWTITDLHSTNGVLLLDPHGREMLLAAGSSAKVAGPFLLGEVAMSLSFREGRS